MTSLNERLPWTSKALSSAHSHTVTSTAELNDALADLEAQGGGTVRLDGTAGPYDISARNIGSAEAPIVITALDPETPPKVTKVNLVKSSHVALANLDIHGGASDKRDDMFVAQSDNIALVDSTMSGTADRFLEKWDVGKSDSAVLVRDSQDITFAGNLVQNYYHGFGALEIDGLTLSDNEVTGIQGDGFRAGGIQNALISDNNFHDFFGSVQTLNHTDMIQFWSTNAKTLNSNIEIRGNVLDSGGEAATQSIFFGHESYGGGGPASGRYENITIGDNVIRNGATNAIAIGPTDGLTITNNTLLWDSEARTQTTPESGWGNSALPAIRTVDSRNVTIESNIAPSYLDDATTRADVVTTEAGLDQAGTNFLIDYKATSAENYAASHFVNALTEVVDARDTLLRADSPLEGTFGARLDIEGLAGETEGPLAVLAASGVAGHPTAFALSAGQSRVDGARIDPADAQARWTFGDGSTADGWSVTRAFATPGAHEIRLDITAADGSSGSVTRVLNVPDPLLFELDFADRGADTSSRDSATMIRGSEAGAFVSGRGNGGFHLTEARELAFSPEELQLFGLDSFELALSFRQDSASGTGGLVYQHGAFELEILKGGALGLRLETTEGRHKLTTEAGLLDDTDWHDIAVRFEDYAGTLSVTVDGTEVASTEASGSTLDPSVHTLMLGRAWDTNAKGVVDAFSMRKVASEDVSLETGTDASVISDVESETESARAPAPEVPETLEAPVNETLLDIDFETGVRDGSGNDLAVRVKGSAPEPEVAGRDGTGFHLTDASKFEVAPEDLPFSGLEAFEIAFDFRRDDPEARGKLVTKHTVLDSRVTADDGLTFFLRTDAGKQKIRTEAGALDDTDWHDIALRYDAAAGEMAIVLDGEVAATGALEGQITENRWGLTMGNNWGRTADGVVDDVTLTAVPLHADDFLFG